MACVKGMACPRDDAVDAEGEGAFEERDASSEGSTERTGSAQASDVGSHSRTGEDTDEGSCTRSYYYGPSTVTVSCVRKMVDRGYFADGMAHVLGEETISEPNDNEVVVFEEFFTAGLRMPLHPVLSDILLKFQVQLHQLTPNIIV
jgi:hypothetical protein